MIPRFNSTTETIFYKTPVNILQNHYFLECTLENLGTGKDCPIGRQYP